MERLKQEIAQVFGKGWLVERPWLQREKEGSQRLEAVVQQIREEYQRRNELFLEKSQSYEISQALEELNRKKLQGKGIITTVLPFQIIREYPFYIYQVNKQRGVIKTGIIKIGRKDPVAEALKIPLEKAVMSLVLEWDRNHRVKVEIDGGFKKAGVFGGVSSCPKLTTPGYFRGYYLCGQNYALEIPLSHPTFGNNLEASLVEAFNNSKWHYFYFENSSRSLRF